MSDMNDLDPSIAALLTQTQDSLPGGGGQDDSDFGVEVVDEYQVQSQKQHWAMQSAVDEMDKPKAKGEIPEVDLSITAFEPISKYFEDTPSKVFDDPSYYKACLTGEGQSSQRLHQLLVKYLNCQDKKDRTVYRQQIVTAYWEFLKSMAPKMVRSNVPECKRMAMRFGVVLPSLFSPEQKDFFSRSIMKNNTGEPVLYMDEWIKGICTGQLTLSATDEVSPTKSKGPQAEQQRLMQLKSKNSGKLQSSEGLLTAKEAERTSLEIELKARVDELCEHSSLIGLEPHKEAYTEMQKKLFADIMARLRALQKVDKDLNTFIREFQEAKEIEQSLDAKVSDVEVEVAAVGAEEINSEMGTIRQMAKMTCGRQGNQFPILSREFFHCFDKTTGFRENVIRELAWIESIDPGCFIRIHRNAPNRIVPYTLLVPSYGDRGFCWEPFDRYNRITSRGRICIPMYPRDLRIACLTAVADLRWQVAKEKASFDWMTDGLTGHYYQYLEEHKMKGDIKSFFIEDYILWMTKEANGTQKLEKEVRFIFWRFLPFPDALKEDLNKRSPVYRECIERDKNRAMSTGY